MPKTHKVGGVDYIDILWRLGSDLSWANAPKRPVQYIHQTERTPTRIKAAVLKSARVQHAVHELSLESGNTREGLEEKVKEILGEMGHCMDMTYARAFGYVLTKIKKRLFHHIYVNESAINQLKHAAHDFPLMLVPSHRSYLDFLLISYICFHYDLPLPAIASAIDFLSMKFVSTVLRRSGAFFMRRSFASDKLYWAVFSEYVQTHIRCGDAPLEFFIEGTRSRTGKSLPPRVGLMSVVLEPFLNGQVHDIQFVPVSITYERHLEEKIYAYEMLGIPKPKETTSGLLKARGILQEDFGNVYVHFSEPVSVRSFFSGQLDRSLHNTIPRSIPYTTRQELAAAKQFAYHIIKTHQESFVVRPWLVIAAILLQQQHIKLHDLISQMAHLKCLFVGIAATLDWDDSATVRSTVLQQLVLHSTIVAVDGDEMVTLVNIPHKPHCSMESEGPVQQIIESAVTHLMLASYRNQLLHTIWSESLLLLSLGSSDHMQYGTMCKKHKALRRLLGRELVLSEQDRHSDLHLKIAVGRLQAMGMIECSETVVFYCNSYSSDALHCWKAFLQHLLVPFFLAFWLVSRYLQCWVGQVTGHVAAQVPGHVPVPAQSMSDAIRAVQGLAARLIHAKQICNYEILSLNMLDNVIATLVTEKAIGMDNLNAIVSVNLEKLEENINHIKEVITVPDVDIPSLLRPQRNVLVASKL